MKVPVFQFSIFNIDRSIISVKSIRIKQYLNSILHTEVLFTGLFIYGVVQYKMSSVKWYLIKMIVSKIIFMATLHIPYHNNILDGREHHTLQNLDLQAFFLQINKLFEKHHYTHWVEKVSAEITYYHQALDFSR